MDTVSSLTRIATKGQLNREGKMQFFHTIGDVRAKMCDSIFNNLSSIVEFSREEKGLNAKVMRECFDIKEMRGSITIELMGNDRDIKGLPDRVLNVVKKYLFDFLRSMSGTFAFTGFIKEGGKWRTKVKGSPKVDIYQHHVLDIAFYTDGPMVKMEFSA